VTDWLGRSVFGITKGETDQIIYCMKGALRSAHAKKLAEASAYRGLVGLGPHTRDLFNPNHPSTRLPSSKFFHFIIQCLPNLF